MTAFFLWPRKIAERSHLIMFAAHTELGDVTVDRYIEKHAKTTHTFYAELDKFSEHMKLSLAAKTLEQNQYWAQQQTYIALGNFLTCAAMMKIDSCPMTGFDNAGCDGVLGLLKKGLTNSVICPLGRRHPNDVQALCPKVRFDYDQIIMEI